MRTLMLASRWAAAASLVLAASCGGNDNGNPAPTTRDASSSGKDGGASDARVGHDAGSDVTVASHDAGAGDTSTAPDVSLDTGSCVTDSSACNSCYSDAQAAANRYNACSAYTKNCVPFTTTVPAHPTL
jgi:hypothetical protein